MAIFGSDAFKQFIERGTAECRIFDDNPSTLRTKQHRIADLQAGSGEHGGGEPDGVAVAPLANMLLHHCLRQQVKDTPESMPRQIAVRNIPAFTLLTRQ